MSSSLEFENPSTNIIIPEEWSEAANFIAFDSQTSPSLPPVALICGPKNCGKSTFSRYLLNVFLQRYQKVVYLDSDVGQPEFTPPGFLSLTVVDKQTPDLSTPCLKTPDRCFFFGDVSSKRDPTAYVSYANALYDHYRNEYQSLKETEDLAKIELPLVVNTPGWVKGIGYEILVKMLKYIAPTYVVKINISAVSKNLPVGAFWLEEENSGMTNLIELRSARQDSFNRSILIQKNANLMRDLRIMAYFRQCFPRDLNITTIKELAHALASCPPYQVPISSIKIRHLHCQVGAKLPLFSPSFSSLSVFPSLYPSSLTLARKVSFIHLIGAPPSHPHETLLPPWEKNTYIHDIFIYASQVPSDQILYSLNATIVGLAICSKNSENLSWCVGLGIVRGIDTHKGLVYVITPVPHGTLEKVDLFLQGFIQIPSCLLQVKECISPYMSASILPTSS